MFNARARDNARAMSVDIVGLGLGWIRFRSSNLPNDRARFRIRV
jgi:hypothetical protein